ncbi:hypothetical protein ACOMHN_002996 [Nucella lapillus]
MQLSHSIVLLMLTVTFPTHQKGHTLDLALSRAESNILCYVSPDYNLDLSDHFCIVSQLNISRPTRPPVHVEARNIAAVYIMAFKNDLNARLLASPPLSVKQLHSRLMTQVLTGACGMDTSLTHLVHALRVVVVVLFPLSLQARDLFVLNQ